MIWAFLAGMACSVVGQCALHTWAMWNTRKSGVPEDQITPWELVLPIVFWPATMVYSLASWLWFHFALATGIAGLVDDEEDDQ